MFFNFSSHLATTFDFKLISETKFPGISLIVANNEDAFNYLTEECRYLALSDGSVPIFPDFVGDFINDAEHAHLSTEYV